MCKKQDPTPKLALDQTRHQLFLGDDAFVEQYKKAHRKSVALSLNEYQQKYPNRNEAMTNAYLLGAYTMSEIGDKFGVHYMTVSRAVRYFEEKD